MKNAKKILALMLTMGMVLASLAGCGKTPAEETPAADASVEVKEGYALEEIELDFKDSLDSYLKDITTELTYSKVYGLLVNHVGVEDVTEFKINNNSSNIAIAEDRIINISEINLSEVV